MRLTIKLIQRKQEIMNMKKSKEKIAVFPQDYCEIRRTTGEYIKKIRIELNLSQKCLAKQAGIAINTLRKLEKGQYIRRYKTVVASCFNALVNKNMGSMITILDIKYKIYK